VEGLDPRVGKTFERTGWAAVEGVGTRDARAGASGLDGLLTGGVREGSALVGLRDLCAGAAG
jgi:hypothetical protein